MKGPSVSRRLAEFVNSLSFESLPAAVIERAKDRLLDALGTAIAGRDSPYFHLAQKVIKDSRGEGTVIGHDLKVSVIDAAFINAILIDSIGQTDTLHHTHPGGPIVATTLAVAEQQGSTGAEVITALVGAYDVMARVFLGAPSIVPRFRGVPVFGPFGATVAAGKLLRLNETQLTSAIGYAANGSSGLNEGWLAGTMEAKFHFGTVSRNGMTAAILAEAGAVFSETSLDGQAGFYQAFAGTTDVLEEATADLGKRYLISETTYKPYPVCNSNQVPVGLAVRLAEKHRFRSESVIRITEMLPYFSVNFPGVNFPGPFTTRFQATMSAQFCAAAALLGRPVTLPEFYDANFADPEVGELTKKVELIGEKSRDKSGLARMIVVTKEGGHYTVEGNASEMLTPAFDKIQAKFDSLASGFLGREKTERIIDMVLKLDKLNDIRRLTQLLGA